ncbi:MAG: FapA family protein, partial [Oscillospiraceae bacterium]
VARILELESVGTASGNILFVGTVHVKGDVSNGFSVRAGGNIVIDGVAENAVLVAGGNIVISGGMKGMGKDLMVAEGNICTLFMENAHVKAKGSVYADVILNSEVECETCVRLMGQSGKLIGGRLTAGEALLAMELGNNSNMPTWIFLKNPDTFGRTRAQNMLSIAKYKEAIVNLEAAAEFAALSKLDEPAPEVMLCRAIVTKLRLERKITRWEKENEETREQRSKRCYIDVKDSVFPNVIIEIDDVSFKNTVEKPGCYITKVSDKLVFRSNR